MWQRTQIIRIKTHSGNVPCFKYPQNLIRSQAVIWSIMTTIWGINMSVLSCVLHDWKSFTPGVSNATWASSFYVAHSFAPNETYDASQGSAFDSRTKQRMRWPITTISLLLIIFCLVKRFAWKTKPYNWNSSITENGTRIISSTKLMILLVSVSKNYTLIFCCCQTLNCLWYL